MGNVRSMLTKPLRTFNIESRTEKVLAREKPMPSPTFTAVEKQKELVKKLKPNFMEEHSKKNKALDNRLKEVFVTSNDPVDSNVESTKPLPKSRDYTILEYGVYEPTVIPIGKCTLRQAVQFLQDHRSDPDKYSVEDIAISYKLEKAVVENIIKHFRILHIKTPEMLESVHGAAPLSMGEFIKISQPENIESGVSLKMAVDKAKKYKNSK